jgi:hypothetical protein
MASQIPKKGWNRLSDSTLTHHSCAVCSIFVNFGEILRFAQNDNPYVTRLVYDHLARRCQEDAFLLQRRKKLKLPQDGPDS